MMSIKNVPLMKSEHLFMDDIESNQQIQCAIYSTIISNKTKFTWLHD